MPPDRSAARGLVQVAGAASLWGLWSLVLRPTGLPATLTSPIVLLFVALWSLPAAIRERAPRWDAPTATLLVVNGLLDAINFATFFAAIEHTSVAIAVLTHYLAPILIAVAAPRVDRMVTPGAPAAALVATVGLALVLEPWRGDAAAGTWLGATLGATSAAAYAANVFIVRRLAVRIGAARALSYHAFIAVLVLAPLAAGDVGAIEARDLALLAGGSLVLGAIAGIAFIDGLARIGAAQAAVLTFAEPLVAVGVGWLAWDEGLSAWAAVGGALVLGAGVAVARAPTRSTSR